MSKQVGCTPTSSIGELTLALCAFVAWQSLLLTSYLSFGFLSARIVLIDVSLSHLFVFLPHHFSLFHPKCQRILLALIHCMSAQSRKGEDQFNLYLASGLRMSQNKIAKDTKCETLVDCVLN